MMADFEEEEYIDLGKYLKRLKVHWKTILWWAVGAFVIGCVVALCTPRKYTVVSKLAPELSSTAVNRLSSVASMMGLSSTMLGTTDAVYPMVYPDLVRSTEFISDLFEAQLSFKDGKESVRTTLYDYLLNYRKKSIIGAVMSLPGRAIGWIVGLFRSDGEEPDVTTGVNPFHLTKEQGKVARMLGKCISAEIDKKTMVITVVVTMQDAVVCAQLSRAVCDNLKRYVTDYRISKAEDNCEYYEKIHEEARAEYYAAQNEYSRYVDSHQGVTLRSSQVESERLKNEANLKYELYNTTAQQLQNARAKVQLETPVFAEIIPPSVPLKPSNSKKKTALAFAFLGIMAGAAYVLVKFKEEE